MKVFIVGDDGPEHNSIRSVHSTYESALKEWNKLRMELLEIVKGFLKSDKYDKEMWKKMVRNLECEDPDKIDNYPQETPYIHEWEVKE